MKRIFLVLVLGVPVGSVGAFPPNRFIRGDCNSDGRVNSADISYWSNWWSQAQAQAPILPYAPCHEALNVNGDGALNPADNTYFINYIFYGGPMPPTPFPICGDNPVWLPCYEEQC